jgi:hypothetical protein
VSLITLLSDTAYHSFIGEVEALNTTTIRRLISSRRHQLLAIALCWARMPALRQAQEAEIHKLYRCHDRLLGHKQAVFDHLVGRWRDLFNISYDVLLYDLTSTPAFAGAGSISRRIRHFRKATSDGLGTRAITGRIVCRSSSPWW